MLIERLLGVGLYTLLLAVVCLLLLNARTSKRVNFIFNMYLFALCVMAFFYIPGESADLLSIRNNANAWIKLDFATFWKTNVTQSYNPAANLFIYFCSLSGIEGFLPMACALIYYGNAFYMFKDLYNRHHYSTKSLALSLFFLMAAGNFVLIIANVRTFTAMSILTRCFYDETMNGKPIAKNILWYLIASLFHAIVLVTCVFRFAWLLFSTTENIWKRFRNIMFAIAVCLIFYLVGKRYFDAAINKAIGYLQNEVYSFVWSYWISGIIAFVVFLVCCGSYQNLTAEIKNIRGYTLMVTIVACIFVFEYSTFNRLTLFSSLMLVPCLAKKIDSKYTNNLAAIVFLCSLVMLGISVTRGNLSGYKFFLTSW